MAEAQGFMDDFVRVDEFFHGVVILLYWSQSLQTLGNYLNPVPTSGPLRG